MADPTDYPEPQALRAASPSVQPAAVTPPTSTAPPLVPQGSSPAPALGNVAPVLQAGTQTAGAARAAIGPTPTPAAPISTPVEPDAGVLRGALGKLGPAVSAFTSNPVVQGAAQFAGAVNVGNNTADAAQALRQGNYGGAIIPAAKAAAGTAGILGGEVAAPVGLAAGAGMALGSAISDRLPPAATDAIGRAIDPVVKAFGGQGAAAPAGSDPPPVGVGQPPQLTDPNVLRTNGAMPGGPASDGGYAGGPAPAIGQAQPPAPATPPPMMSSAPIPGADPTGGAAAAPTGAGGGRGNVNPPNVTAGAPPPIDGQILRDGTSFSGQNVTGDQLQGVSAGDVSSADRIAQMQRDSDANTALSLRKQQASDAVNGVASAPGAVIMDGTAADAQRRQDFFDRADARTADDQQPRGFTSLRGGVHSGGGGAGSAGSALAGVEDRITQRDQKQKDSMIAQQDNLLRNRTTQRGQDMELAGHQMTNQVTARGQDLDFQGKAMETGMRGQIALQEAARANRAFERDTANDQYTHTTEAVKARGDAEDKLTARYASQLPPVLGPDGKTMVPDTAGAAKYTQAAIAAQASRQQQLQQEIAAAPNDPNVDQRKNELASISHYGVGAMDAKAQTDHFAAMRAADLRNSAAGNPSSLFGMVKNSFTGDRPMVTTTGPSSMTLRKRGPLPAVYDYHGPGGEYQGSTAAYNVDNVGADGSGNAVWPGMPNQTFDTLKRARPSK